jgi:hypothetical protein
MVVGRAVPVAVVVVVVMVVLAEALNHLDATTGV